MSTKKKENSALIETQHNGVTMILEKKSNGSKAPTPEMQARMEAGKVEIMKVVEGVPGAEKLGELIERGKKKGNLSSTELMDVLEDMDLESDQMDKIYDTLENLGIDTVGEDYIPDLPDDADPPLEAMEEINEEEMVDPNSMVDAFGTDDPVRMYLKEIGKVNLLSSDEEIELAQAMDAGNAAKSQLEELEAALRPDTVLVSMMLVNNELGTLLPVAEAAQAIRDAGSPALLHCDAVQAFLDGKTEDELSKEEAMTRALKRELKRLDQSLSTQWMALEGTRLDDYFAYGPEGGETP